MGVEEGVSGRLYGIGVGPGDPELVTLKAARLLAEVAVIAYPAPTDGESTARAIAARFIPAGRTEITIRVPMRPGEVPVEIYDQAAQQIAEHLEQGRDVAVLCEGDPLFYGSYSYLHERLAARFPVTVVPGVTSLTACAAAEKRPLVTRDGVLTIVPATLPDNELAKRLADCDAAALMKVGRHLPRVKSLLESLGLISAATYVAHATRRDQVVAPLGDLKTAEAPYFSMILISQGAAR